MTINEAYYITTIIQEGSLNKAAEKLYLTQPTLTKCIHKIEEEYSILIFERKKGSRIKLTKEGELLYKLATKIVTANDDFRIQLNLLQMMNDTTIGFGMPFQRSYACAEKMFRWFYDQGEGYQLEIGSDSTENLFRKLKSYMVDIIYASSDHKEPGLYYEHMQSEHMAIYLSSKSDLKSKAQQVEGLPYPVIHLADIQHDELATNYKGSASRKNLDEVIAKNGIKLNVKEIGNLYSRLNFADQGNGHCIFTGDSTWFCIDVSRICYLAPDEDVPYDDYLVCRKGYEKTDKFKIIKKCVEETSEVTKTRYEDKL